MIWFGREWVNNWLAEWKAQAPTRRAERYRKQMQKDLRRLPANSPARKPLVARITQIEERLHEHKMSQLELKPLLSPKPEADASGGG